MKIVILGLILILNSSFTLAVTPNAKSCTPVDLREKLGKVRNQDSMGWCFAFGAADVISYKLGQKISAADLAHERDTGWLESLVNGLLSIDQLDSISEGSTAPKAIQATKERGWCLEKDFPSEDNLFSNYMTLFKKLSEYKANLDKGTELDKEKVCEHLKLLFPKINADSAFRILKESSITSYYSDLAKFNCRQRIKHSEIKIEEVFRDGLFSSTQKFHDTLDKQLDRKNVVGFSYHADVYTNPSVKTLSSNHSSVIVGRRFNQSTKSCEYLVRNSWGRSCGYYHSSLKCEEGNIWLPQNSLMNNTTRLYYAK